MSTLWKEIAFWKQFDIDPSNTKQNLRILFTLGIMPTDFQKFDEKSWIS